MRPVAVAVALGVVLGACGSSTVDLESLGLAVAADVPAGGEFELVVPARSDTTIAVVSTPPGVSASVTEISDGDSIRLALAADPDTPRGSYNVALLVTRDGTEHELGWPFDVIDPYSDTTQLGSGAVLTVDEPEIGALFPSPSRLSGTSSSTTVSYNLVAGETVIAQGTIEVVDGEFASELTFTNTCCIEMMLEVYQPGDDGLSTTIPVAFPESG